MAPAPSTKTDIFGVCTAVGRDLGFHPDILRIAFAAGLFANAAIAIAAYATLGAVVAASRWLFPDRRRATRPAAAVSHDPRAAVNEDDRVPMLEAA